MLQSAASRNSFKKPEENQTLKVPRFQNLERTLAPTKFNQFNHNYIKKKTELPMTDHRVGRKHLGFGEIRRNTNESSSTEKVQRW